MTLWGEVRNAAGQHARAELEVPEPYALTASAAIECVTRLLSAPREGGVLTPSMAFGANLITDLPGVILR